MVALQRSYSNVPQNKLNVSLTLMTDSKSALSPTSNIMIDSSDASIKSGHGSVTSDKSMQAQSPDSNDDALAALAVKLLKIKLTLDGTDIHERRRKTMLQPCSNRRQSKRVLELRALERTLKVNKLRNVTHFSSVRYLRILIKGILGRPDEEIEKFIRDLLTVSDCSSQFTSSDPKSPPRLFWDHYEVYINVCPLGYLMSRFQGFVADPTGVDRGPYRGFLSFCDGLQLIKYQFNLPRLIYRGKTESRPSRFRFNLQSSYGSLKTMKVCAFLSAEINFLCSYFQEILLFEQRSYLLTYKVLVWTQYYLQRYSKFSLKLCIYVCVFLLLAFYVSKAIPDKLFIIQECIYIEIISSFFPLSNSYIYVQNIYNKLMLE
ncbi:hypothetical protein GQR58_021434 [Nymphon striatum]|nr:hypothetical protein GQR58_021434 [Nymphon striatum]